MPVHCAPSAAVFSTSPEPCSKIKRCLTPAWKAKNALDIAWEVLSGTVLDRSHLHCKIVARYFAAIHHIRTGGRRRVDKNAISDVARRSAANADDECIVELRRLEQLDKMQRDGITCASLRARVRYDLACAAYFRRCAPSSLGENIAHEFDCGTGTRCGNRDGLPLEAHAIRLWCISSSSLINVDR